MSTMGVVPEVSLSEPCPDSAALEEGGGAQANEEVYLFEPSFAQQRLWFLDRLELRSATYNLPVAIRLRGRLNASALERCLNEVVRRHESLRTTFAEVDGRAVQVVNPPLPLAMSVLDITGVPGSEREERARKEAAEEARRPFDLARGPLLRARLLLLAEEEHVILVTMHHIVSDGWSMGVLVREIAALYEAFIAGKPSPLAPLPIQYADFAHWQRHWLEGDRIQEQLAYWKKKLAGAAAALDLPTDRPRPAVQTFNGASHRFALSSELTAGLRRLCRAQGATLYMALLAGFNALLHRITGQTDVCIGSPIANRNRAELEGLIGFFVNTLVLRTDLSSNPPFHELLARVRESALGAYAHQDLPFERLVEELAPARDLSRTPLFQVVFVLQNAPIGELELSNLTLSPIPIESGSSKFDLTLEVTECAGELRCAFEFNADLFERSTVERLAGHLTRLLQSAIADPNRRVGELAMLSDAERATLLVAWNDTQRHFPREKTILDLFEEQVARAPEAVAVAFEDDQLTYGQLDSQANRLSRRLHELGAGPDGFVAILLPRSISMVTAQVAALKTGAAYIPLDPSYPSERLRFMLGDSRARVVLTRRDLLDDLGLDLEADTFFLDRDLASLAPESAGDSRARPSPHDLAYVIYTSGSTGTPKGVAVEHRALMRLVAWHLSTYQIGSDTRSAQLAGPAFDAAAWELWPALACGASIEVVPDEVRVSPARLVEWLAARQITTTFAPTALAEVLIRQPLPRNFALQTLLTGGDKLQRGVPPGLPFSVVNHYGPTESTVVATCAPVGEEPLQRAPPIGRPIDNTRVYVLDRRRELLPFGAAGELCIGGEGLARGYLLRPGLTAERFIPDPFGAEPGDRLYCTGDLVRYRPDGNLEFLGRLDRQVKVRGFRVELGEIEAALAQHPSIREAAVLARADRDGERRLVAYLVASQAPSVGELRAFLADKLPEHMIPSAFVSLAALPLTPNGKIDREALPAPDGARPVLEAAFVAPQTESQRILAAIWSELLGVEQVGIHDNFFELGGDSILSIQVIARARQRGLTISPRQIFQHQTIASLAAAAGSAPAIAAEQGPVSGPVPLTPIQAWFFDQNLPAPHHFNQSLFLELQPGFRPELLRPCFERLLEHHDALRLRVQRAGSEWMQSIAEHEDHDVVEVVELSAMPETTRRAAMEARAVELQASLDLEHGPILRVAFFGQGGDSPGRLLIVIHHLAVDAVSWRILLEDLQSLYGAISRAPSAAEAPGLPAKTTSFQRWAERLREYSRSDELRREQAHWSSVARGPWAPIPVDRPEGANTFGSIRHVTVSLEEKETLALLQEVPAAYRTQINDVLLTALSLALSRHSGGGRILVDLEGHGREELFADADLSRTVGWFTSLFPLALDLMRPEEPGAALKCIKEQLRGVPRKGVGYGILRYLSEDRQASEALRRAHPIIGFNYLGQARSFGAFHIAVESPGREHDPAGLRAHLLDITAVIKDGRLLATWMYSDQLHERQTIDQLAESFLAELRRLIAHCLSPGAGGCTPSDFPLVRLDQASLDARFGSRRDIEDLYPLSPMQQGMLFHTLLAPDSGVYFEQFTCSIHAPFDTTLFELAWRRMLERHSVLRSSFLWEGLDQPLQTVFKHVQVPLSHLDWRDLDEPEASRRFDAFLRDDRRRGFDLSEAPLLRLTLIRVQGDAFRFVCAFHHLLLDGWSLSLALQELFASYSALHGAKEPSLEPALPYRHYLEWLSSQDPDAAERFWREELKGFDAATPLGIERAAPSGPPGHSAREVALSPALTAALQDFARAHQLTLNTVIQGLWALLLSRYSGRDDVLFGATVAGRPPELAGAERMIGLFINTLPMRVRVLASAPLAPWLQAIQARSAELRQYEHSPLVQVQSLSELPRGVALFNHILVFENYPVDASLRGSGPLAVSEVRVHEHTNYPITVVAKPGPRLAIEISYDRQLVDSGYVEGVLRHFTHLLEAAVADPTAKLESISLLAPAERQMLLEKWNATEVPYPRDRTIVELFEEQVARAPDALAVVFEGAQLTYSELDSRADRLARHLLELGAGSDRVVAVLFERSLEMVIAELAVLKSGSAYLPLDPSHPPKRLAFMVSDSGTRVLITREGFYSSLRSESLPCQHVVCIEGGEASTDAGPIPTVGLRTGSGTSGHPEPWVEGPNSRGSTLSRGPSTLLRCARDGRNGLISDCRTIERCKSTLAVAVRGESPDGAKAGCPGPERTETAVATLQIEPLSGRPTPGDIAYVIYTSGSTGAPKGVAVEHRALMRLIAWHAAAYRPGNGTRAAQLAGPAFDAAAWELWPALGCGACVEIVPEETRLSSEHLATWLAERGITHAFAPTALAQDLLLQAWPEQLPLRVLLTGGDKLRRGVPPGLPFKVVNHYGPTECAVVASCAAVPEAVQEGMAPPIGLPIDNTQAYVLDRAFEPVPIGVPGELCLGGDGLARGYLGRPRLTAEKFVPDPFSGKPGARLYCTGDLARRLPDGNLEFLGRLDQQVKVRGFRVELEEVEAALTRHDGIRGSAVVARAGPDGEAQLVAYFTASRDLAASELRAFLRERLPEHMVPTTFIALPALPLTANGKIDRRALPEPEVGPTPSESPRAAPRTRTELILWNLWQRILGRADFGVTDRFLDVGGHSLGIIRLVGHIEDALGVRLSMQVVMANPTIELLASAVQSSPPRSSPSSLVPIQTAGPGAPLFLVHPAGGTVACYFDLARCLGSNRPVYGLQAIGIDDESEPLDQLEPMAEAYVRAIRELQPDGPYFLAGWSAGGQIAFEMANQLAAVGQRVAFLGLLDADATLCERLDASRAAEDEKLLLSRFFEEKLGAAIPEELRDLPAEEQMERALTMAREQGQLPQSRFTSEQALRALRVYRGVRTAVTRAPPRRYAGDVTLIRAASPLEGQAKADAHGGWQPFVEGALRVLETPGDHETLMREPHCRALATILESILAEL